MAYLLIDPKVLKEKNIDFFETIPDGRAVMQTNVLKVLGSVKNVEFIATTKELNEMVDYQKKHLPGLSDNNAAVLPDTEDSKVADAEAVPENSPAVLPDTEDSKVADAEAVPENAPVVEENGPSETIPTNDAINDTI